MKAIKPLGFWDKAIRYGVMGTIPLVWPALKYITSRYILRRRFFTRRVHSYKLRLDLEDPGLSRDVAIRGSREEQLKYLIQDELQSGEVAVDLGANIGYYTMMMAQAVGESGKIYALEPEPKNYQHLKENIRLNAMESRIETWNMAGSDHKGTAKFYVSEYSNLHTFLPKNQEV